MLVYDITGVNFNKNYNKRPYMFMSKQDGSITDTLNIYLPVRYSTSVVDHWTDTSGVTWSQSSYFWIDNNRHFGHDFIISDVSSDTIYLLTKDRVLTPLIVRTPSVHSTNPNLVVTHEFSTDKFICLSISALDYDALLKGRTTKKTLMVELETLEISYVDLITWYISLPRNTTVRRIFPDRLKEAYEIKNNENDPRRPSTKIPEALINLAPLLGEEDNPVVYLMKFK